MWIFILSILTGLLLALASVEDGWLWTDLAVLCMSALILELLFAMKLPASSTRNRSDL